MITAGRSSVYMFAVMAAQFVLASIFVVDFFVDVVGLRTEPTSYSFRELVQIAAWTGLLFGIVLNALLFRIVMQRSARLEQRVRLAAGAFQELIDETFTQWCLTPTERDVAILAIKGFSNTEIAKMLEKSEGTVKAQSTAVFRKAGVSGRVQLISYFMDELLGAPLIASANRELGVQSQII